MIFGAAAIPALVLLHDYSDQWLASHSRTGALASRIPFLNWFRRSWIQNPRTKASHLTALRNFCIFFTIGCSLQEKDSKFTPLDYVVDRLQSAGARRNLTSAIQRNRSQAVTAGLEALSEAALDENKADQLRSAVVRRRVNHEALQ